MERDKEIGIVVGLLKDLWSKKYKDLRLCQLITVLGEVYLPKRDLFYVEDVELESILINELTLKQ